LNNFQNQFLYKRIQINQLKKNNLLRPKLSTQVGHQTKINLNNNLNNKLRTNNNLELKLTNTNLSQNPRARNTITNIMLRRDNTKQLKNKSRRSNR